MMRKLVWTVGIVLLVLVVAIIGGSFYMLDFSLAPDPERTDTAFCFREQFKNYPETRPWVDSLRRCDGLRDTFVPTEMVYRLHAAHPSNKKLWIAERAAHAESYSKHRAEYLRQVQTFLQPF